MDDDQQSEAIRRYLNGNMDPIEQQAFEQSMQNNAALQEAYRFHKQVYDGLALNFQKEKKQLLRDLEARPSSGKGSLIWYRVAAVIGLLLIIGGGGWLTQYWMAGPTPSQLADQSFQPFPNYLVENYRNRGKPTHPELLRNGMDAYEAASFPKARTYLEQAVSQEMALPVSRFYLGNTYLALNKPQKAIKQLTTVKGAIEKQYRYPNLWYLSLAYLQADQPEKAKPLLQKLAGSKSNYQTKAQHLLQALD